MTNTLYYGDNLDILRRHVADESLDLIHPDPPLSSNADYTVLFTERNGAEATAQIKAFEDTRRWDTTAAEAVPACTPHPHGGHRNEPPPTVKTPDPNAINFSDGRS